jgi:predicted O-methyltransferase YrrM
MYIHYDNLQEMLEFYGDELNIDEKFYRKIIEHLRGNDEREHGKVLFYLVKKFKAHTIYDAGTARGFSAVIMAKAVQDNNLAGRVYTYDVIPNEKKVDWHARKQPETDPAMGRLLSRDELLDTCVPESLKKIIEFKCEDCLEGLRRIKEAVDLAFIDISFSDMEYIEQIIQELISKNPNVIVVLDSYDSTGLTHSVKYKRLRQWIKPLIKLLFASIIPDENEDRFYIRRPFVGKFMRSHGTYFVTEKFKKSAQKIETVSLDDSGRTDYGLSILYFGKTV